MQGYVGFRIRIYGTLGICGDMVGYIYECFRMIMQLHQYLLLRIKKLGHSERLNAEPQILHSEPLGPPGKMPRPKPDISCKVHQAKAAQASTQDCQRASE